MAVRYTPRRGRSRNQVRGRSALRLRFLPVDDLGNVLRRRELGGVLPRVTGDAGGDVGPAVTGPQGVRVSAAGSMARLASDVDEIGSRLRTDVAALLVVADRVAREALRVVLLLGGQKRLEGVRVTRLRPHRERLFVARGAAIRARVGRLRGRRSGRGERAHGESLRLVVLVD